MKIACIVNYNTPHLVEAAIMSLQRCTPYCKVVVFDNSDREKPLGAIGTDIGKALTACWCSTTPKAASSTSTGG